MRQNRPAGHAQRDGKNLPDRPNERSSSQARDEEYRRELRHRVAGGDAQRRRTSCSSTARSLHPRELPLHLKSTMTKRILVPVGQSESHATMSVVRGLARDQGSLVRLLRVVPVPELVMGRYGRTIAYVDQEMERLTAQGLEELMCPAAELEGVPVERVVRFGEPAEEILLEADAFGADLIAVTTSTRSRLASALAPGLGERVLREAPVPVLLLRD